MRGIGEHRIRIMISPFLNPNKSMHLGFEHQRPLTSKSENQLFAFFFCSSCPEQFSSKAIPTSKAGVYTGDGGSEEGVLQWPRADELPSYQELKPKWSKEGIHTEKAQGREWEQSEDIQIGEGVWWTTEKVSKYIKYNRRYVSHYWRKELRYMEREKTRMNSVMLE